MSEQNNAFDPINVQPEQEQDAGAVPKLDWLDEFGETIQTQSKQEDEIADTSKLDWLNELRNIRQQRAQQTPAHLSAATEQGNPSDWICHVDEKDAEHSIVQPVHPSKINTEKARADLIYREPRADDWVERVPSHTAHATKTASTAPSSPYHTMVLPEKDFGDEELNEAHRQFLQQQIAKHNANIPKEQADDDVALLVMEDWLLAQSSLTTERKFNRAQLKERFVVDANTSNMQRLEEAKTLPEYVVNVYDLPKLPASKSINVVSEQELLRQLNERLMVHLSEALTGMVRQAVQKKMAILGQELQVQLNQEAPQLVKEVLDYQLANALKNIKYQLRQR